MSQLSDNFTKMDITFMKPIWTAFDSILVNNAFSHSIFH